MAAKLAYRHFGTAGNPPLVILHGLLGSARNWLTVGRDLAASFDVYALDLRNHGDSPHEDAMDYELLVEDVLAWLDSRRMDMVYLLGHSLGGKAAMALACRHPERLEGLIVADIAPKDNPAMLSEFEAMERLDLEKLSSRAEAEEQMTEAIPSLGMRRFLLTNLERGQDGTFRWSVNLPALSNALTTLALNPLDNFEHYNGPCCFIRGGKSDFINDEDLPNIRERFPEAQIYTLSEAGHNVHVDDRPGFVRTVLEFTGAGE